ncbi:hypothetical protein KIPB_005008 [Kipferlia bialata]|uniref:DUF4201 domain-containing protein n=1 Tax=Kipferlia bialata TaxID=797122 RepID=A0A9K3GGY6_9EUKA|nr:hypothetical protein KIPB_005008 [Kipferlia bialata]|eukprot:g5008.t1
MDTSQVSVTQTEAAFGRVNALRLGLLDRERRVFECVTGTASSHVHVQEMRIRATDLRQRTDVVKATRLQRRLTIDKLERIADILKKAQHPVPPKLPSLPPAPHAVRLDLAALRRAELAAQRSEIQPDHQRLIAMNALDDIQHIVAETPTGDASPEVVMARLLEKHASELHLLRQTDQASNEAALSALQSGSGALLHRVRGWTAELGHRASQAEETRNAVSERHSQAKAIERKVRDRVREAEGQHASVQVGVEGTERESNAAGAVRIRAFDRRWSRRTDTAQQRCDRELAVQRAVRAEADAGRLRERERLLERISMASEAVRTAKRDLRGLNTAHTRVVETLRTTVT